MKKIKKDAPLWALKTKAFLLGTLSKVLPLHAVRRSYLRAFYMAWEVETGGLGAVSFDPDDVYNGHEFEWSHRPLPPVVADRLLELHDAQVERERSHGRNFKDLLERNLRHH